MSTPHTQSLPPDIPPPDLTTLIQEIQQTPPTQWAHLLEILRIFRQSVTPISSLSGIPDQAITPTPATPPINQAAIDLLRSWREDGDTQEQRETWEFLQAALDEDRLSDRPLFPS